MRTRAEQSGPIGREEIEQRAREIWESEGRQDGRDLEHWLRAERELRSRGNPNGNGRRHAAPTSAASTGGNGVGKALATPARATHI